MILVDTSVWVDHLRKGNSVVKSLLENGAAATHPFIVGELACGSIQNRSQFLSDLKLLPTVIAATDDEALFLIEERRLWGTGIGWVDAHLLASARLSDCRFWTMGSRLAGVLRRAGVKPYLP